MTKRLTYTHGIWAFTGLLILLVSFILAEHHPARNGTLSLQDMHLRNQAAMYGVEDRLERLRISLGEIP